MRRRLTTALLALGLAVSAATGCATFFPPVEGAERVKLITVVNESFTPATIYVAPLDAQSERDRRVRLGRVAIGDSTTFRVPRLEARRKAIRLIAEFRGYEGGSALRERVPLAQGSSFGFTITPGMKPDLRLTEVW